MATLQDMQKNQQPMKQIQFVEQQLALAKRRIRTLDMISFGLYGIIGTLVAILVVQLVDRYFATPPYFKWVALAGYLGSISFLAYWLLFRPARRHVNPYYAAKQLEAAVPDAKNSVISYVDFSDDDRVPGSIKQAIGGKAAKDLKGVEVNRQIENPRLTWVLVIAGIVLAANAVVAILPPTRTQIELKQPRDGNITVFNNQDVIFEVELRGRVPAATDKDAARVRIWYNPEDPGNYEERPLNQDKDNRRLFQLTVPANQVRSGFRYSILAGNDRTPDYQVISKILPEFKSFEAKYNFPSYLKRETEIINDPNLLAPWGTQVVLTAHTNREVQFGKLFIEGNPRPFLGKPVADNPNALQFDLVMEQESTYHIEFTTKEGDQNQNPPRYQMQVIDPKPAFRTFDVRYEYPDYLNWKPAVAMDVAMPTLEGIRGTKITLTARFNRPARTATVRYGEQSIVGVPVTDEPLSVRFELPPLDRSGEMVVEFIPDTAENPPEPKKLKVLVFDDLAPQVELTAPVPDMIEIPLNGSLQVKGLAKDDYGIDRLALHMKVAGAEIIALKPKKYRDGQSFFREKDNSWPRELEYQDVVLLSEIQRPGDAAFRLQPGMVIEYWLEATDNCNVPPGPYVGYSKAKQFKVLAAVVQPQKKAEVDRQNADARQQQRKHEQKQDQVQQQEKRDPNQQLPKDAKPEDQQPGNMGDPMNPMKQPGNMGDPMNPMQQPGNMGDPMNPMQQPGNMGDPMNPMQQPGNMGDPMNPMQQPGNMGDPIADPKHAEKTKEIEQKLNETGQQPADPGEARPAPKQGGEENQDPKAESRAEPKKSPDEPKQGETRDGMVDQTPEDKGDQKPAGKPNEDPAQEKRSDGSRPGGDSADKPYPKPNEAKDPTQPMNNNGDKQGEARSGGQGMKPGAPDQAGEARPEPPTETGKNKPDPLDDPTQPEQQFGKGDENNPGENKPQGPQDPKEALDREMGKLDRELNSKNREVSEQARESIDRLMRNPKTREQTRDKLDEMKKNAQDELTKKKADELSRQGEKAAQDADQQQPNKENVDELAKKNRSDNPLDRQGAEEKMKEWMKNEQTKKDLKDQVDELKKRDPEAADQLQKKMYRAEQANRQEAQEKQNLDELSKKMGGNDPMAKEQAKKDLQEMMNDPAKRDKAIEQLKEMAKNEKDPNKKQQLQDAAQQAEEMAKNGNQNQPDPKQLEDLAKKMGGNDPMAKEQAKKDLQEMLKDPAKRDQAIEKLKEMAKNAPENSDMKKDLEKALDEAKEMAKNPPKMDGKDLADMVKKMNENLDPKEKEKQQKQFEEMMKDENLRKKMQDMAKEMQKTPEGKKQLEDFLKNMGGTVNNEFTPLVADPRNRLKSAELLLDKFKKNISDEEFRKSLNWTDAEWQEWMKNQEALISALKKQVASSDWNGDKTQASVLDKGPRKVTLEPGANGDLLRGGRYAPPPGYENAYRDFTKTLSGVKPTTQPRK
ncbi:MAG: hypothetical protein R3B84_20540 [Zavarzinella sp.]